LIADGKVLLQQRSRAKYHSAGLWANSCCGHPAPGERTAQAARRASKRACVDGRRRSAGPDNASRSSARVDQREDDRHRGSRAVGAAGPPGAPLPDIVSGSRYLKVFDGDSRPPESRRRINETITTEINARLGFSLTDAFCGFKDYTRRALSTLHVTELGYAMPLEVWVQASVAGLRVVELPVPLLYLDLARSFGGALDDAETRLAYYRGVLDRAEAAVAASVHDVVASTHGAG
jgi:hypothetical protein